MGSSRFLSLALAACLAACASDGAPGKTGAPGAAGPPGAEGSAGSAGSSGTNGADGDAGPGGEGGTTVTPGGGLVAKNGSRLRIQQALDMSPDGLEVAFATGLYICSPASASQLERRCAASETLASSRLRSSRPTEVAT